MKVTVNEHQGCFGIDLAPETMAEAALLVRLGVNATAEIRTCSTKAYNDGTFGFDLVLGKHRRADSAIPSRGRRR